MSGQIPPYGKDFEHDRVGEWHPALSDTVYKLKIDNEWFIRSDKSSKRWYVFHGKTFASAVHYGRIQPNMRGAMKLLLDGIDGGYYVVREGESKIISNRNDKQWEEVAAEFFGEQDKS